MPDYQIVWPDVTCRDGWVSSSAGPGSCSHHGGVDYAASNEPFDMPVAWVIGPIIGWIIILAWWRHATRR